MQMAALERILPAVVGALAVASWWLDDVSTLGAAQMSQLGVATLVLMAVVGVPLWLTRRRLTADTAHPTAPPDA